MEPIINFILDIWLYLALGLAGVLAWRLAKKWKDWAWLQRICLMALIVLVFHAWEEWRIPGGFAYSHNNGSLNYPMNRLTDMLTIVGGLVFGTIFAWNGVKNRGVAIPYMLLGFVECLAHLVMTPLTNAYGSFYNPGMATVIVSWLPATVGILICLIKDRPNWKQVLAGFAGFMVVITFICLMLPEILFSNPDSPYAFPDRGYWERYEQRLPNDPEYQGTVQTDLTENEEGGKIQ